MKDVQIRQPGSGAYAKRFGTLVLTLTGDGTSVPAAMIFRGTGKRITAAEKAAWHPNVPVFFKVSNESLSRSSM